MRLHFTSFNTESSYDKVRVYDGNDTTASLLYTFSGTSRPSDVFSSGNTVFVSFVTDGSNTRDGFNIVYSTIGPGKTKRLCKSICLYVFFFRIPLSLNMLRIQAGKEEKSEIYIYFFRFWCIAMYQNRNLCM